MNLPVRKPNRMKGFDYSSNGAYFITIITKNREHYFGKIKDGKMRLNKIGNIAEKLWLTIPEIYNSNVELDEFVIMPNHIHGLLLLNGKGPLLSSIIKGYKRACTKQIHKTDECFGWQKSFHDRIIRKNNEYERIKYYIQMNPEKWYEDKLH